ncbi:MAG: helix-turn-helix domain-containing protein [Muribaculaceae bacterium]|jgi:hypothetical protein|nr:helix-turn-helix domain-containing protein [Muribaculaceae bacterium]
MDNKPTINLEELLDGQDIMQLLHISPRTLQTLRSNGTIPHTRLGRKIYYRRQDIENILRDNYVMTKIEERYVRTDTQSR